MNINSKTKELYDYIIKNPNRRIKEISGDLRINERKVRYEIGNLNFLLSVNRIKSRILNIDGNIKLEESSETMNFDNLLNSIEKLSMESRRDLILLKLLLNDLININKLSRELGGCSWKFSFTVKWYLWKWNRCSFRYNKWAYEIGKSDVECWQTSWIYWENAIRAYALGKKN